jgi:hypothetical protein
MADTITVTEDDLDDLTPQQLLQVMREEIRLNCVALAEHVGWDPENVHRAMYWAYWPPEDCGKDTLAVLLFEASYTLRAVRDGGMDLDLAWRTMAIAKGTEPGTRSYEAAQRSGSLVDHLAVTRSTGRAAPNATAP